MSPRRTVIVVGNFDGVHQGHQALFRAARGMAAERDAEVLAVSFDRHPLSVLRPEDAPPRLMHRAQRLAALSAAGADQVEWIEPTRELLDMAPERFIDMLCDRFDPVGMVEGRNFRFGKRRTGTPELLEQLAGPRRFDVFVHEMLRIGLCDMLLVPVSSSLMRWLIWHGRVADAAIGLGRPYALLGTVVPGDGRGQEIGYPTVNLDVGDQLLPRDGVYGGTIERDGQTVVAAVSVGRKPTFGAGECICEAHLLDFDGDLYGTSIELTLDRWIRPQMKFGSAGRLTRQLDHDVATIRQLARSGLLIPHAVTRARPAA